MRRSGVHVLLVEDDDAHAMIVRRGFQESANDDGTLDRVRDGSQAMSYVHRRGEFRDRPLPDVILLDLKLPRMDGLEVLQAVKADEDLKAIPIVVLTTSAAESDRRRAYRLHANSYLVKPTEYGEFRRMIADFLAYWGGWNRQSPLPPE